jgi:hypothetical protein
MPDASSPSSAPSLFPSVSVAGVDPRDAYWAQIDQSITQTISVVQKYKVPVPAYKVARTCMVRSGALSVCLWA